MIATPSPKLGRFGTLRFALEANIGVNNCLLILNQQALAWSGSRLKLIFTLCLLLVPTRPSKCSPKSSNFALDFTSSSSECDSEPDQVPTDSEKTSKKRRQRTTFSAHEVWAMERAFKQCPYLLRDDEMQLVYRLGIPAKSVRVSCLRFSLSIMTECYLAKQSRQIFRWSKRDHIERFTFLVWANSFHTNGA